MTRQKAINYMKQNPNVYLCLDWWNPSMGVCYKTDNKFYSMVDVEVKEKFFLEGNWNIKDDSQLGGLFSIFS